MDRRNQLALSVPRRRAADAVGPPGRRCLRQRWIHRHRLRSAQRRQAARELGTRPQTLRDGNEPARRLRGGGCPRRFDQALRLGSRRGRMDHRLRPSIPGGRVIRWPWERRNMTPKRFSDRREAGRLLGAKLAAYANRPDVVVLARPRGGVPVAFEVPQALNAPLDVFVVRKLGVPGYEELAMGAVATGGLRGLNDQIVQDLRIPDYVIDRRSEE